MITKRDKQTEPAARDEGAEKYREEWQARATREAPFEGEVDPASMVISPHTKPKIESETKTIGAHAGDPRVVAANAVDTPTEGTETPWRDTPPTNVSSTFETNNDHSPPHDPDTNPDDLDSMHEDLVPPEGELPAGKVRSAGFRLGQDPPPIETRTAVEVFPPEREAGREPARPRRTTGEPEPVQKAKR